jgi:protein SCO1
VVRSYQLGILIVVTTVLISLGVCLAWLDPRQAAQYRAGQDLGAAALPLGHFELFERSGRTVTQNDLAGRICIASFIFTRCPLSCPRITSVMKGLQPQLAGTDVLLLSISVDPEHDTPAVLAQYARRYGAAPDRWWFLTGPKTAIHELVRSRFKLALEEMPGSKPDSAAEAISHSDRLVLIDHGKVTGYFDSTDPAAIKALTVKARQRALPAWIMALPTVNAALNALCAALLLSGWTMIRGRNLPLKPPPVHEFAPQPSPAPAALRQAAVRAHLTFMGLAVAASSLFLTSYLVYHYQAGSVPFQGGGLIRLAYFTILLSHTTLATFGVVPLVLLTLSYAVRGRFNRHVPIARVTFPIWMYVSITGVVIYLMLYHAQPTTTFLSLL